MYGMLEVFPRMSSKRRKIIQTDETRSALRASYFPAPEIRATLTSNGPHKNRCGVGGIFAGKTRAEENRGKLISFAVYSVAAGLENNKK